MLPSVATLQQKIGAELKVRALLENEDVTPPDRIEYGRSNIRLYWDEPQVVLVVDLDDPLDDATAMP